MKHIAVLAWQLAVTGLIGCQSAVTTGSGTAHLYPGLDRYHYPISTDSPEAQRWFDQGLQLAYGFNHDEAIRSFRAAAEADPDHPMPWWGIAYAYGMNINDAVMTDERWQAADAAAWEARQRLSAASAKEAALVSAVAARYSWPPPEEQATLDMAYAEAMETVWKQYPKDPVIAVLFAESLMDLQPWDYWTDAGDPKGRITEVVDVLESVLETDPAHPGATHFYIHAVEASSDPDRAVAASDQLRDRVPGSGHLVHMPSHIDVRVGRYADAADTNVMAIAADRRYLENAPEPGIYWIYYAHNLHFLAYASMMEGRDETALQAARELERDVPDDVLEQYAGLIEGIMPSTFHVMIRFGRWDDILLEPERPEYRLVSRAVRHYARGIAYAALGQTDNAAAEIEQFEIAAAAIPEDWWVFNNKIDQVLPIADAMLEGELAFREGRYDEAFTALRRAVALEDALVYDEPPAWMLPVRHSLGALLMSAGRYAEAEAVYRADLRRNRNNGWALLGLQQALAAQGGGEEEIEAIEPQLLAAWNRADVRPTSSCLCEPQARWAVQVP